MSTPKAILAAAAIAIGFTAAIAFGLCLLRAGLKEAKPSPSKDFVEGFEAGVRYGLIARAGNPSEDSIPKLTEIAKAWYWRVVVDGGYSSTDKLTNVYLHIRSGKGE